MYKVEFHIDQDSSFQPFPSRGTHEPITKILQHTKKYIYFCQSDKNRYNFDSHSRQLLLCCLLSFFKFDNLREKRSAPVTK